MTGVVAYEATPPGTNGSACNVDNVLGEDGAVVGLDRTHSGVTNQIAGVAINGCVGVELAEEMRLAKVVVRAAAAADACGESPCGQIAEGCGTGREASIHVGTRRGSLEVVSDAFAVSPTLRDYSFEVNRSIQVIVVCRTAWGDKRDDIVIDAIYGVCP